MTGRGWIVTTPFQSSLWTSNSSKESLMDKFGQNRSFLVTMIKIASFWGQNEVIGHNLGKGAKNLSLKVSKN